MSPPRCPRRVLALAAALLAAGCADDTGKGASNPDHGLVVPVDQPAPVAVTCNTASECRDYVISKLVLPTNATDAQSCALRLENGQSFNALGGLLSALTGLGLGPNASLQDAVDDGLYQGSTIVLARLRASDFVNDERAAGQTWVGQKTSCCPDAGSDLQRCKEEALQRCFVGDPPHAFPVDETVSQSSVLSGSLRTARLSLSAPSLRINLPLTGAGVMPLELHSAQLRGLLTASGVREGALAGTISKIQVQQVLIPGMAQLLDGILRAPATTADLRDFLGTVFDRDKDGQITAAEVASSSIRSLLEGDVDTDHDGERELSLGIGFEAVPAIIQGK